MLSACSQSRTVPILGIMHRKLTSTVHIEYMIHISVCIACIRCTLACSIYLLFTACTCNSTENLPLENLISRSSFLNSDLLHLQLFTNQFTNQFAPHGWWILLAAPLDLSLIGLGLLLNAACFQNTNAVIIGPQLDDSSDTPVPLRPAPCSLLAAPCSQRLRFP